MARQHYDVVVTGRSLGSLVSAALLARRAFRVLLVCGDTPPPTYSFESRPLSRRMFTLLVHHSPVWQRVLAELAQSQTFRRRIKPLEPMFQALLPKVRMDIPPDGDDLLREVERFYPSSRRDVEELYASLAQVNRLGDEIFSTDLVFPPGNFWERREVSKALKQNPIPFGWADLVGMRGDDGEGSILSADHPFGELMELTIAFGRHLANPPGSFADCRLHGAWTRGPFEAIGGEASVFDFLTERVRAHGGDIWEDHAVTAIETKRGRVVSLEIDGEEGAVGTNFVVSDKSARDVVQLSKDLKLSARDYEALPEFEEVSSRFVTSLWVKRDHVPALLANNAFLPGPVPLHVQCTRDAQHDETLLVAESIIREPERAFTREAVVEKLEREFPFLGRGLLVVDSPHDGLPLHAYEKGKRHVVERARLRPTGGRTEAEEMEPQWKVHFAEGYGAALPRLSADAIRTPVGQVLLTGKTVLPALGQEGELLAAWSVARIVTKSDKQKERMRREMWRKVELG
ncbi:MAG: hypothetical protein U0174_09900 [Polyangiaceae bacterium]